MMAGNPNWWSIQYPPSQSQTTTLSFPPPHHHQTTYMLGSSSSSLPPFNYSNNFPPDEDPPIPSSWSQFLLGTNGSSGNNDEDKFGNNTISTLSHHHFQPRKLENWDEDQRPLLLGNNNNNDSPAHVVKLPAAAASATTTVDGVDQDEGVKQEGSSMKRGLVYSQLGREEECLQGMNRSNNNISWSPQALVSSPKSCVTTATTSLGSNNMLDFSYYNNSPDESSNQNTDHFSECHSTDSRGPSNKKARVQASSSQPPLKVRKEKLGDRITALHQLVSPFGKTDTASVLLEAIGYIRFLHTQIEALSSPYLGNASKNMRNFNQQYVNNGEDDDDEKAKELKSRGLCLVPVSFTEHVGSDNGADYWAPAAYGSGF
ncbi:transcription factor bHLH68 [Cannabis sativa]|uniref:transcription factor bHLH68 n=1 Tax=Cannabis sativa TaxID=3483 RepID=UPI0029CA0B5B|nr:transcription factor bHLH68 [Cannabis sativa]